MNEETIKESYLAENEEIETNVEDYSFELKREDLKKTKIVKQTWSIQEIYQKIKNNKLILDPSYQRNTVWGLEKKIPFIESLFMGILVPPIYVVEVPNDNILEENSYEVVDGKQRLSTIMGFLNNEIILKDKYLEYFGDCFNNKNFTQISENYSDMISEMLSSVLDIYVITANSPEFTKYDIFSRLNKGAEQLKANEIRKAIYRSPVIVFIEEYIKETIDSDTYSKIFTKNQIIHYNDYGRFFRSISFYINSNIEKMIVENYNSRPRDMINNTLGDIQRKKISIDSAKVKCLIDNTIKLMLSLKDNKNMNHLIDCLIPFVIDNNDILYQKLNDIINDQTIITTFEKSPATTANVNERLRRVKEILCN